MFGLVRVFMIVFGCVSVLFGLCSGTVRVMFGLCSGPEVLRYLCMCQKTTQFGGLVYSNGIFLTTKRAKKKHKEGTKLGQRHCYCKNLYKSAI